MKDSSFLKDLWKKRKTILRSYWLDILLSIFIVIIICKAWNPVLWEIVDAIDIFKISVTILISMMSFSVSIYVFLNTVLQERRRNSIEKEIVKIFQSKKQEVLGKRLVFSVVIIILQSLVIAFETQIVEWCTGTIIEKYICISGIFLCVISTLINISWLGRFAYGIINYENGLKQLAIETRKKHITDDYHQHMNKGEFLNLVNNIEVLVERLIENHMHAKTSNAYESNFKRALCDGITEVEEIVEREQLSKNYKEIIDYRNLLLQDETLRDNDKVDMGDSLKSVMNRLFKSYLKNESLTNVNISNLTIKDADISKVSFSKSTLRNIIFSGKTDLTNTDLSNTMLNEISFEDAKCTNANFSNSRFIDVQFNTKMDLQRAIFVRTNMSGMKEFGPKDKDGDPIQVNYARFDEADLSHLKIHNCCFDFCSMKKTSFVHSELGKLVQKEYSLTFKYADMIRANLLETKIKQCNFQNSDLSEAVFTHAELVDCNLSECRLTETNFTEGKLVKCKLDKAYCKNVSFKEARVNEASFSYATLNFADMSGAYLELTNFSDAVCRESLWVRTPIENSKFIRCVFTGARIVGENNNNTYTLINMSDFSFANFTDTAISNIEFKNCDFYGADFSNSRLINVRFTDYRNVDEALVDNVWAAGITYSGKNDAQLKADNGWRYYK